LEEAKKTGAATVGMPLRYTVKQVNKMGQVESTPDRETIWEIQTPQVVARGLLIEGFAHIRDKGMTVTDDVSVVELLGKPVKVVEGCHTNIKVTIPADLVLAEQLLQKSHEKR
jgi:2-C-methyl-D-erythritol 4-phosphate cytidylyltransferase